MKMTPVLKIKHMLYFGEYLKILPSAMGWGHTVSAYLGHPPEKHCPIFTDIYKNLTQGSAETGVVCES